MKPILPQLPKEEKVDKITPPAKNGKRKFFVMSTFGELLDIAIHLKEQGEEVVFSVPDPANKSSGDGIVTKDDSWHKYLGEGYIWVIDGCENADLQDWLRGQGEYVVGTNTPMAELEDDRQKGQAWFKDAGFHQPESQNFADFDDAIKHIKDNPDKRFILKQNGGAPKSLNHLSKFPKGEDMLFHLEELKKSWKEHENGKVDFDLMEVVEGVEIAASAFFNGHDWLRDSDGKVVGYINIEEKKESDGGLGETTGETGTVFVGVDEDNEIFSDIILRPEITDMLRKHEYHGVFDINGSLTDKGYVAFEATSRFGIPATSYEFMEGLKTDTADLLEAIAKGWDIPVEVHQDYGMVIVVTAKPYPLETENIADSATSIGQRLWILKNGEPIDDFTDDQKKHIHLENFKKDEDGNYRVATKAGYLLTVTGRGDDIAGLREDLLEYIKENIYIEGMKYRQDIGKRIEDKL